MVTPTRAARSRSRPPTSACARGWGFWELLERLGTAERRRVYPDFAQIARYAWLAGDRRLQEIGIKTYQLRGQGTDFKQLSEYRVGDSVRHIDWRATLRLGKPIVREFQDERDQCVLLLVDCGRRMRADDREARRRHDALRSGAERGDAADVRRARAGRRRRRDDVRHAAGEERSFAPRKGTHTLNALMGQLYDVQPTPTHSDYVAAARMLLAAPSQARARHRHHELPRRGQHRARHALRLLRSPPSRAARQPARADRRRADPSAAASGGHVDRRRQRASLRAGAPRRVQPARDRDALMVDAEPERLGVELVNRYHAVKRAGLI